MSKQPQNHSPLKTPKSTKFDRLVLIIYLGVASVVLISLGIYTGLTTPIYLGLIWFVFVVIMVHFKYILRLKSLISTGYGKAIQTHFLELKMLSPRVGSHFIFRLRTQWLDAENNKVYHFLSQDIYISDLQYLYTYPEYLSAELKSAMITVMINPYDPKKYYFDDAEILRIINQFIAPNLEKAVPILKKKEWEKMQKVLEAEVQKIQKKRR